MKTLSVRETVKVLGCSRQNVYNLLVEEKLPATKDKYGRWEIKEAAVRQRAAAKKLPRG